MDAKIYLTLFVKFVLRHCLLECCAVSQGFAYLGLVGNFEFFAKVRTTCLDNSLEHCMVVKLAAID